MIGIYFLIKNKKVIYIGQTKNWARRLYEHKKKGFDSTRFMVCDKSKLRDYEVRWIRKFKPELNTNIGGPSKLIRIPISMVEDIKKFCRDEMTAEEIEIKYSYRHALKA